MNITVVIPMSDEQKKALEQVNSAETLNFHYCAEKDLSREQLSKTDILVGNIPPARLKDGERLSLVQLNSAGTEGYTAPGVLPAGAKLANASGAYGLAISEHMLGMILSLLKKLPEYRNAQTAHKWIDAGQVRSIYGSRTLVIGLGNIGGEFAKRMKAMGSTVVGLKRTAASVPDYVDELYTMDHLDEEIGKADFVACTVPGSKETYHLFNEERFAKMKSSAVFINVARGTLVDSNVLARVLRDGVIGGACIDVADPEPLPADSPLWDAPNLILTPHISGGYHLEETKNRILGIARSNIQAICDGREIRNRIV